MKTLWNRGWQTSKPLMLTGQLMLLDSAVCLAGLALDPELITGQPGLAETTEVCDLGHLVLLYVGVDPFLCRQKSPADARDGVDHQRGVRSGNRNYRFTGRTRNDQSLQQHHSAGSDTVRHDG